MDLPHRGGVMLTSKLASAARWGRARSVGKQLGPRPEQPLVFYEFEGCPFCRRTREAVTDLGLTVQMRPCPKRGERFRPESIERSGKRQFPFLVDPNTGTEMLESADIVRYLYRTYGTGEPPRWLLGPLFAPSSQLASLARAPRGAFASGGKPAEGLRLRGNEGDPAARLVRERLCELELPYLLEPGTLQFTDGDVVLDAAGPILEHLRTYA